jgi:hypothetical protein
MWQFGGPVEGKNSQTMCGNDLLTRQAASGLMLNTVRAVRLRCLVFGTPERLFGVSAWYLVSGTLVSATWYQVLPGTWYVPRAWCLVPEHLFGKPEHLFGVFARLFVFGEHCSGSAQSCILITFSFWPNNSSFCLGKGQTSQGNAVWWVAVPVEDAA